MNRSRISEADVNARISMGQNITFNLGMISKQQAPHTSLWIALTVFKHQTEGETRTLKVKKKKSFKLKKKKEKKKRLLIK